MAIKLTKNEQKKQKDSLKQFERYLPTLQLKKKQLQSVIEEYSAEIAKLKTKQKELESLIEGWVAVYAENKFLPEEDGLEAIVKVDSVSRGVGNIAGVTVPVFNAISFKEIRYNLLKCPLWVDRAVEALKESAKLSAMIDTHRRQLFLLNKELRSTSQRVNLFEKVMIPQAKENIRVIGIYLGDQDTAAVVRGKIAKAKLQKGAEA